MVWSVKYSYWKYSWSTPIFSLLTFASSLLTWTRFHFIFQLFTGCENQLVFCLYCAAHEMSAWIYNFNHSKSFKITYQMVWQCMTLFHENQQIHKKKVLWKIDLIFHKTISFFFFNKWFEYLLLLHFISQNMKQKLLQKCQQKLNTQTVENQFMLFWNNYHTIAIFVSILQNVWCISSITFRYSQI